MNRNRKQALAGHTLVVAVLLAARTLLAQGQAPNIGYLYPAGGTTGTSFQIVVGGMNLQGLKGGRVSGGGIVVESARLSNPFGRLGNDQRQELRPIIEAIDSGNDPIEMSRKSTEKALEKLKKQAEKEAAEKKAAGGTQGDSVKAKGKGKGALDYEEMMRIVPGERLLYIDKTPEEVVAAIKALTPLEYQCLCKTILAKPNALQASPAIEQKAIVKIRIGADAKPGPRELRLYSDSGLSNPLRFMVDTAPQAVSDYFAMKERELTGRIEDFPRVLNGEIMPGEVDRWKFHAKAGETVGFAVKARDLVPYLGDAVPGWFQAVLSVHDHKGTMLAYCDDNRFDPDPVLVFTPPATGDYEVRIRDSIYRGREDFVYRLGASTTGIGPEPGLREPVFPFAIRTIVEKEDNNSPRHAQPLSSPVLVKGVIGAKNDTDCFRVALKRGQKLAVEILARRLGSPVDSVIQILDSGENVLQWNDDTNAVNVGLETHHADSSLIFEAPEDGQYGIRVSDAQAKGGSGYGYYLRVDAPRPDYAVYMTPSALTARGGVAPFRLKVVRREGFTGAIDVVVKEGPAGVKVDGSRIPPGVGEIVMTLSLPRSAAEGAQGVRLAAVATVAGKVVEREVIAADEVMQAFIYLHLLPAAETILFVAKAGWVPPFRALTNEIVIKPGERLAVTLDCPKYGNRKEEVALEPLSGPPGLSVGDGKFEKEKYVFSLEADPKAKAWQGNLVFQVFMENAGRKGSRRLAGCLPAIPARILAQERLPDNK